jgi:hypothetical protein
MLSSGSLNFNVLEGNKGREIEPECLEREREREREIDLSKGILDIFECTVKRIFGG